MRFCLNGLNSDCRSVVASMFSIISLVSVIVQVGVYFDRVDLMSFTFSINQGVSLDTDTSVCLLVEFHVQKRRTFMARLASILVGVFIGIFRALFITFITHLVVKDRLAFFTGLFGASSSNNVGNIDLLDQVC